MADWTDGYRADIDYTYGYYTELNPLKVQMSLLTAGIAPPPIAAACELGFGQGLSLNVHAAASSVEWHGTDFNPGQAVFARQLAAASGAKARPLDQSFEEFCARADLPDFDYIGLHGIWSWISDGNRRVITDFIHRKLTAGGVLYVSYNTMPGWAPMVPMRHVLTEHVRVLSSPGRGIGAGIEASLGFMEKLMTVSPGFARANPTVAERLTKMKGQNKNYIAHEYFNQDWQPMPFSGMAKWLEAARMSYAGPAHALDSVDAVHLTKEAQALLKDIPDAVFRETVRDVMVNQQFRRDYWVKGARRLPGQDQVEALRLLRFILMTPRAAVTLKVQGAMGEAAMSEQVYAPVLDALADRKPRSLGDLERALLPKGVKLQQLVEALKVLIGKGDVMPVQSDAAAKAASPTSKALNRHLIGLARSSAEINYLASPLTGGGVPVDRLGQLFLQSLAEGAKTPADWAKAAWAQLAAQGQRMMKDGAAIEGEAANLAEIDQRARDFSEQRLPVLRTLMVV